MSQLSFAPFKFPMLDPFNQQQGTVKVRKVKTVIEVLLETQISLQRRFQVVIHEGVHHNKPGFLMGPFPIENAKQLGIIAGTSKGTRDIFKTDGEIGKLINTTFVIYDVETLPDKRTDKLRNEFGVPMMCGFVTEEIVHIQH